MIKFLSFLKVFCFGLLILQFVSTVPIMAQTTTNSSGGGDNSLLSIKTCSPDVVSGAGGGSLGANSLIQCFQTLSTLALIFGIIIGGILSARDVLASYIPGQEIDSSKNFMSRIQGLIIGIIFISLPGAVLTLFNPAATGIDFLSGLESIRSPGGSRTGGQTTTGANKGNSGNTPSSPTGNKGNSGNTTNPTGTNSQTTNTGNPSNPTNSRTPALTGIKFPVIEKQVGPAIGTIGATGKASLVRINFNSKTANLGTNAYIIQVSTDPNDSNYYENYKDCLQPPSINGNKIAFNLIPGSTCKYANASVNPIT